MPGVTCGACGVANLPDKPWRWRGIDYCRFECFMAAVQAFKAAALGATPSR